MDKLKNEGTLFEIEDALEKARFMICSTIDAYDLEKGIPENTNDAMAFGFYRNDIYTSIRIIHDYLIFASDKINELS